jgi:hypothetical protein
MSLLYRAWGEYRGKFEKQAYLFNIPLSRKCEGKAWAGLKFSIYSGTFLLPPHTQGSLLLIRTTSTRHRASVSDQVNAVSRRLLRIHETRRTMRTTKPATQREEFPLKLQAHSIALKHQPSCGDDHKQGLRRHAVAQYLCMASHSARLLHRINPWEAAAACMSWASLLSAKRRPELCCAFDWPGASPARPESGF